MDLPLETPEVVDPMGPHPLTIHLIAESIFSHLESIEDLLSCRKVAWTWRQIVITLINSRIHELRPITFSGSAKIENPNISDTASSPLPKLRNCMNYLKEESEMEPKLSRSHFRFYNLALEQPLLQQFLNQFGHTIRKLDLNAHIQPDYREFDKIGRRRDSWSWHQRSGGSVKSLWNLLSTQCTQLEDLKFGTVKFQLTNKDIFPSFRSKIKRLSFIDYYLNEELSPLVSNIFQNCQLLENLILQFCDATTEQFSIALQESPHLSALKELTLENDLVIRDWFENQAHSVNIQRNLRLRKLKIASLMNEWLLDGLNWFLNIQKTSLETFIVGRWYFFFPPAIPQVIHPVLPSADVMEKLREFRIRMDFDALPLIFPTIDLQRRFPSLKIFILEGNAPRFQMDSLFAAGSEPQLILQELELPWGISQEHLARAGEIFPNVNKLRIGRLGELAMQQLFTQWHRLESLFLEAFEGHDSILTGLSSKQMEAAEKIRVKIGTNIHRIISLINPSNVAPSITNFKNLKELRLHNSLFAQPLTDLSLHYALSQLKDLEFLAVIGQKFSEEGIKDLLKSIPHLRLCKDEDKRLWKLGLQCQKDLSKEYNAIPIIDGEHVGSFYFPNYQQES